MSTVASPLASPSEEEEKNRNPEIKKQKKTDERFFIKVYPIKEKMGYSPRNQ
jgi:hypothetical protein